MPRFVLVLSDCSRFYMALVLLLSIPGWLSVGGEEGHLEKPKQMLSQGLWLDLPYGSFAQFGTSSFKAFLSVLSVCSEWNASILYLHSFPQCWSWTEFSDLIILPSPNKCNSFEKSPCFIFTQPTSGFGINSRRLFKYRLWYGRREGDAQSMIFAFIFKGKKNCRQIHFWQLGMELDWALCWVNKHLWIYLYLPLSRLLEVETL